MIIAGTGHRKFKNNYYPSKTWHPICEKTIKILEKLKPEKILSGGAIGFDSLLIDAAISLKVPYILCAPFKNQSGNWPLKSKQRYDKYLEKADEIVIVSEGGFTSQKMQIRNEYLVDNCNLLLAFFNGEKGGTYNCVKYANFVNRKIINIID